MNRTLQNGRTSVLRTLIAGAAIVIGAELADAQNLDVQQRVAEMKQAAAANKQALMQYTWQEQVNIIVKGEQKKQERFRVQLGPDGKAQRTPLDPPVADSEPRGPLKRHIVEKKKEEFKEYEDQIKELIQQYVPPEKDFIERAYQQGNVMIGPMAGGEGQYRMVMTGYIKKGDKMTLVIDKAQKSLASISIDSYLDDPSNAVNVSVQFSSIPGGPNHVASQTINGVKKQLMLEIRNTNYEKK